MAEFILADEVEELKYNFEPFGPKGNILEPSAAQIQSFRQSIADMLANLLPEELDKPEQTDEQKASELRRLLIKTLGEDQTATQQKALHALAEVCSDSPSFDVLNALPWRHQQAFSGWISGVFLLPQTKTPATNG
jgi:hypothetical protein